MTMFTKHVIKQLSAYCNGELAADQAQRVQEHLHSCERCRKEHDEIKLGVNLAQQLPLATAPAEMWSEIEALLDERSRRPVFETKSPRVAFAFSWYRVAAVSAALVVSVAIGFVWFSYYGPRASWTVDSVVGNVRIGGDQITDKGSLAVGETIETGSSSKAKINVAMIGEVVLDPNTRVSLVKTQLTEHRLALDRGLIHAKISAPPRLFFVDTPSAEAIDLGCEYSLEVDAAGRGRLHVTLGEVALVRDGREVYVPRYAMCQSWPGIGPGTPYFEDASEKFVRLLVSFDFENGGDQALKALLSEARERDTFTLWHLLSTVDGERRVLVLNRMIELVELPKGITREAVLRLDQTTLDAWKDEMVDTVWF
jgi:predicted anti-sigma-YlaC factor YlaD